MFSPDSCGVFDHLDHLLEDCDVGVLEEVHRGLQLVDVVQNPLTLLLAALLVDILSVHFNFGVNVGQI